MEYKNQQINDKKDKKLVIKDYIYAEYGYMSIFVIIPVTLILFSTVSVYQGRYLYALISAIFSLPVLILMMFKRKRQTETSKFLFELNFDCIKHIQNNKTIKQINLKNIQKIRKSNDIRWNYDQKTTIFEIIVFIVWISLGTLIGEIYLGIIFLCFFIFIAVFIKLLLHINYGGFSSLRYFDQIVIYANLGDIINIFVATNKEYNELREYFLQILNIDIDKVPRTFSVFGK